MFSKAWDSVETVCVWILFGLSVYFLYAGGLTDRWQEATLWFCVFYNSRRIKALEKNQESQAS
jgi:hypothetical protein